MRSFFLSAVMLSFVLLHAPIRAAECVSSSRAVVAAEYRQILEREPDAAGVQNWVNQLDLAHMTVEQMTRLFLKEREYRLRFLWDEVVTDAYLQVLERYPDPGGLENWANNLDAGAINVRDMVRGLAQSPEYYGRFIAPRSPHDAVRLLYLHLLARAAENDAVVQNWVNNAQVNGWPWVINQFIDSPEYIGRYGVRLIPGRGRRAYDAAVIAMYRQVLTRAPGPQEIIDNWTNAILSQPWSAVVDSFVGTEYRQRFGEYTVPGNPSGPHYGTARFQQCLDLGGTLELPAGVYMITAQLTIRNPIAIATAGMATRAGNCAEYPGECAVLTADPALFVRGGMVSVESTSGVQFDHIMLDGNRAARGASGASVRCRGTDTNPPSPDNRYGFNASLSCESCSFTHSASVNALCGTALEWKGGQAVIEDSAFLDNGDHDTDLMWADGLTLLTSDGASVRRNTFADNTDIDLICGGGMGTMIEDNSIRHANRAAFAGLMLDNFSRPEIAGDFTGAVVSENTIDCGPSRLCDFGIQIGGHPWYLTRNTIGGTVTANTVRNVKQGIDVEGGGTQAAPVVLYGNTVDPISGEAPFRGCTHAVSPLNISDDSWVDRRGDPAPMTNLLWHNCQ